VGGVLRASRRGKGGTEGLEVPEMVRGEGGEKNGTAVRRVQRRRRGRAVGWGRSEVPQKSGVGAESE